ncbi:MAG: FecR family protein [Treponema sp.]|jgi:hypothetical protein|nr:FecR family protein [Treponema sp.]
MKKAIVQFLLLVIFFAGAGICVFSQNGMIKELSGVVELKLAGADEYVPAVAGAQVAADTVISTGFKSTALLEVGSAVIAVRPLTRLTLKEIKASQGTETINVNLQAGRVRVDVKPPAGTKASFSVTSPSATASVRGTSFFFDTRNLRVREGKVAFRGNHGYTVQVAAGSHSGIGENGIASGAQDDNSAELAPPSPPGYNAAPIGGTKIVKPGTIIINIDEINWE